MAIRSPDEGVGPALEVPHIIGEERALCQGGIPDPPLAVCRKFVKSSRIMTRNTCTWSMQKTKEARTEGSISRRRRRLVECKLEGDPLAPFSVWPDDMALDAKTGSNFMVCYSREREVHTVYVYRTDVSIFDQRLIGSLDSGLVNHFAFKGHFGERGANTI